MSGATGSTALWNAVALVLLTLVVVLGVLVAGKVRMPGLPRFAVIGLHRRVPLIAAAFPAVHVLTAVTDSYVSIRLAAVIVPFTSAYEPLPIGLGAVARSWRRGVRLRPAARIGWRLWRLLHWLGYASYPVAVAHSLTSANDLRSGWLLAVSAASASKAADRTVAGLRKLAAEAVAAHAAEDEALGPGVRGDEVPAPLASPRSRAAAADRAERIARALAGLEAERAAAGKTGAERDGAAAAYLSELTAGRVPAAKPPAGAEVAGARARLEQAEAAQAAKVARWDARRAAEDATGIKRPGGRIPFPPEAHFRVARARQALAGAEARQARRDRNQAARKGPGPVRNVTDPDSRLMPTRRGFIQGYNAQNVTSEDGLILATELTADPVDMGWLEPMIGQAGDAAALITAR